MMLVVADEPMAEPGAEPLKPEGERIPFDAFDWDGLVEDVNRLVYYRGESGSLHLAQYDAVKAIVSAFQWEFFHRFRAELKAHNAAQWKTETFHRLKMEFEQEGKK